MEKEQLDRIIEDLKNLSDRYVAISKGNREARKLREIISKMVHQNVADRKVEVDELVEKILQDKELTKAVALRSDQYTTLKKGYENLYKSMEDMQYELKRIQKAEQDLATQSNENGGRFNGG